jgi:ribonuclease D
MPDFLPTISKEDVATLPPVSFDGEIVVVDTPQKVIEACAHLAKQRTVGFDTESRPAFQKGVVNKIALLQLSTDKLCFLFRLNRIPLDKSILKILESKKIEKVGLALSSDFHELATLHKFRPKGFVDLQKLVPAHGIADLSLIKIAAIVLGKKISKAQRLSNWEAVSLTDAQKLYAATDAWICLEIYKKLTA